MMTVETCHKILYLIVYEAKGPSQVADETVETIATFVLQPCIRSETVCECELPRRKVRFL